MTMQINIGDVWKDVDCTGSKINIGGVWKDFDCEDELGGGSGAVQINLFPSIWKPTTSGTGGWGPIEDCCSTSSGVFLNDAETPDTIVPGNSITLTLVSGCGPYNWSTSSTGYSLDESTTSGVTNTLNCAAGSCGTDYEPSATIAVSDACGSGTTFAIRATGGGWTGCNSAAIGGCSFDQDYYYYVSAACRIYIKCGTGNDLADPQDYDCGYKGCPDCAGDLYGDVVCPGKSWCSWASQCWAC